MSASKGLLEPKCKEDDVYGRVKKLFIAYVQNPDEYEIYHPPVPPESLMADMNLLTKYVKERAAHEAIQKAKIERHRSAVRGLAQYLMRGGVAVAYDQCWEGKQLDNRLQHYEAQIRDSDYVLLIITPSFNHYLTNEAPDEEILFADNFLYNMITVARPQGTHFIPVFLNRERDFSLVPMSLSSSTMYVIREPLDLYRGDLYCLYAVLTNQNVMERPEPPGMPIMLPQKKRFGDKLVKKSSMSPNQQRLYDKLRVMDVSITGNVPIKMAAKLAHCWRNIGRELQFSERELVDCETRAGGSNNKREASYLMLFHWMGNAGEQATVAALTRAIATTKNYELLEHLAAATLKQ